MAVQMDLRLKPSSQKDSGMTGPHGGMPPENRLEMPVQSLKHHSQDRVYIGTSFRVVCARLITILGTLAVTGYGVSEMVKIVNLQDMTILQGFMIFFFAVTLGWIAFSAASALAGLIVPSRNSSLRADPEGSLTALLMPIYNEDPIRTTAALNSMAEELSLINAAKFFEIVIISDSTDADSWITESLAVERLRHDLRRIMPVWYRRRWNNSARKAGNVEDFVKRWGGRYDYMVVLDADSLISAETLSELVRRMQGDRRLGILQTVPVLYGHSNLFARLQQFAGRIYGRYISRGAAAWSGDDGNYWGHNAIIRVFAFAESCGIPRLPGKKPFGGYVLSHDFVEAALIRRAGWKVCVATDIDGSWEESPPSLIDVAIRDRRWVQGNLQHIKIIGAKGLRAVSRGHLLIGIMNYLSSPLWLMLLIVGFTLTIQATLIRPEYFSSKFQLFPDWPRFDAPRMVALFIFTMIVLCIPKFLGLLHSLFSPPVRKNCGGFFRLTISALLETVLSALYAPVMMLIHTRHVFDILRGRDSGWHAQRRCVDTCSWQEAWHVHWSHMLIGTATGGIAAMISLSLLAWILPMAGSLVLAILLSKLSGSIRAGRLLAAAGLLVTPEENSLPEVIRRRDDILQTGKPLFQGQDGLRYLANNRKARNIHISGNLPKPAEPRGQADPYRLTAEHKVHDAETLDEALGWLEPPERIHVAGDPQLLERLSVLAGK